MSLEIMNTQKLPRKRIQLEETIRPKLEFYSKPSLLLYTRIQETIICLACSARHLIKCDLAICIWVCTVKHGILQSSAAYI